MPHLAIPPAADDLPLNPPVFKQSLRGLTGGLLVAVLCAGCMHDESSRTEPAAREIRPGDFVVAHPVLPQTPPMTQPTNDTPGVSSAPPVPRTTTPPVSVVLESPGSDAAPVETSPASGAATQPARVDRPVPVDGMVGQINGRPVFADDVLAELEPALMALGQRESLSGFRDKARKQIDERVRGRLMNALILSEAERALTEHEWNGLRFMVSKHRQELLRQHGQGAIAVAERNLRELTGLSLDETLARFRDQVVTETYVRRNLMARVNVSRRDIERYYREHPEQFNPEPVRDLRLIVAADEAVAKEVTAALQAGQAFADVAAGAFNTLEGGGWMGGIAGDAPFGRPAVDEAVAGLGVGAQAGPMDVGDGRFWFVRVEKLDRGQPSSFEDAQGAIEKALQGQQYAALTEQFKERLWAEGNFTRPDQVIDALLEIAVNRYARWGG